MLPALSQVGSLPADLETELEDYSAGKCDAIDLWMTKVEEYIDRRSKEAFQQLLNKHEIRPVSASFQGGLLASQGERRKEAWSLFERRLQLCRELDIPVLVIACDVPAPVSDQDAERTQISLAEAAQLGEAANVRIALEFQANAGMGNNLQTAAALVAAVGSAHLGLCLDAFHYHVGPSKPDDLELLSNENLFLVQMCDLADVPREFATDQHRILPGEGEIGLDAIVARLKEIQYTGAVTTEVLNPQLWQVPSRQFGEIAITSLRKALGQNEA